MTTRAFQAAWLFPISSPPIENGIISIDEDRIVAVDKNVTDSDPIDLGEVAILPGLINAHTHLEFSDLTKPLDVQGRFPEWIRRVIEYRVKRGAGEGSAKQAAIAAGLAESTAGSVAAVGEIATLPFELENYTGGTAGLPSSGALAGDTAGQASSATRRRLEGTIFLELLGLDPDREAELVAAARDHLAGDFGSVSWSAGLSPHAPYTASPELVAAAVALAMEFDASIAMHLAETREEMELLATGGGPLVEFLEEIGAWRCNAIPLGSEPLDYLRLLAEAPRSLIVHGNYLVDEELRFLGEQREQMSLVYCPRTHERFGHPTYPLVSALAAGVRVALGTDSRASNPDLSLFEELRHVANSFPQVSREDVLAMGTINGAEALGVSDRHGSLEAGKSSALTVIQLGTGDDPYDRLLADDATTCTTLQAS